MLVNLGLKKKVLVFWYPSQTINKGGQVEQPKGEDYFITARGSWRSSRANYDKRDWNKAPKWNTLKRWLSTVIKLLGKN